VAGAGEQGPVGGARGCGRWSLVASGGVGAVAGQGGGHRADLLVAGGQQEGRCPAGVGVEFRSTGSDGKIARWSDRSVVTEATRPEVFEFVTDGRRQAKPGRRPWRCTAVHRYVIAPKAGGCKVTYTEDLTRLDGAPWLLRTPA
jgi:hypothetical protein